MFFTPGPLELAILLVLLPGVLSLGLQLAIALSH